MMLPWMVGSGAGVVFPAVPAGQERREPGPAVRVSRAVAVGGGDGRGLGFGMSGWVRQFELRSVFAGSPNVPAGGAVPARWWWRREPERAIRPQPPQHLDLLVGEEMSESGQVIPGVTHHQHRRITLPPVPGPRQSFEHVPDLPGGHHRRIITRTQSLGIQQRRPRCATRFQRGDERVRPARDHLRLAFAAGGHDSRSGPGWSEHRAATTRTRRPRERSGPAGRGVAPERR